MYKTLTIGTDEVEYLKRIFRAAAQFYQIISLRELFGIIVLKYGRHIPEEQFIAFSEIVQSDSDRGFFNIFSDDELFSDEGKSTPMDRLVVHEALTDIDPDNFYEMYDVKSYCPLRLKILPEQELLKYEEDGYLEDTRECSTLRRFFIKNAGLSNCESDDVMGFLAFYSKQPDLRNVMLDALDSLERMGVELSKKQYHEFLRLWIPFHNKLRMPALNGHDPTEARELGYRFLNSYIPPDIDLPEIVTEPEGYFVGQTGFVPEQAPLPVRVQKPGRNDPCPCGSGKKYKKCCGR